MHAFEERRVERDKYPSIEGEIARKIETNDVLEGDTAAVRPEVMPTNIDAYRRVLLKKFSDEIFG